MIELLAILACMFAVLLLVWKYGIAGLWRMISNGFDKVIRRIVAGPERAAIAQCVRIEQIASLELELEGQVVSPDYMRHIRDCPNHAATLRVAKAAFVAQVEAEARAKAHEQELKGIETVTCDHRDRIDISALGEGHRTYVCSDCGTQIKRLFHSPEAVVIPKEPT